MMSVVSVSHQGSLVSVAQEDDFIFIVAHRDNFVCSL